jgi:hypothetical protein
VTDCGLSRSSASLDPCQEALQHLLADGVFWVINRRSEPMSSCCPHLHCVLIDALQVRLSFR